MTMTEFLWALIRRTNLDIANVEDREIAEEQADEEFGSSQLEELVQSPKDLV